MWSPWKTADCEFDLNVVIARFTACFANSAFQIPYLTTGRVVSLSSFAGLRVKATDKNRR
jgi:hypothetical protein